MKPLMEAVFLKALENSAQDFVSLVAQHQSRGDKFIVKSLLSKCNLQSGAQICDALASTTNLALDSYRKLLEQKVDHVNVPHPGCEQSTSPPKQGTRSRRALERKRGADSSGHESSEKEDNGSTELGQALKTLQCCAFLAQVGLAEGMMDVMQPSWLFPTVLSLHDALVLLEGDPNLQESIAGLCELWWRQNLEQKENLIVQSFPFLLSKALAWGRKKDVQRLYGMRNALVLFDFYDESIEDMKHLLIRTIVTPTFLRTQPGRRFISFLFGLDPQLVKELVVIVRSQIPYGRKSILEAYGEILYQAWKSAEGACRHEIEFTCIQGLYEAALYASSKALGASIRTVLECFSAQKAQDGVESMLFWLLEPLLFRALQAANSNVRQNALLVLVDVFPLEDPAASKEEKETVLEKQFGLLEKLLVDPCPDVRSVAVKVVCRLLRLFWEIIPSAVTVKFLTKIVDDMAKDSASQLVRLAVLQGVTYLLENAQSHALLKAVLPKLEPMLNDTCLAVRVAAADLLVIINGIRIIQFYKVVPLENLLFSLGTDNSLVAQRLTRLFLPTYFPPKVPVEEACKRCVALLKRSPQAGAQFCKWLFLEGASPRSLLELVKKLIRLAKDDQVTKEIRSGTLLALSEVCQSLVTSAECQKAIEDILNEDMLAALMNCAPDSLARSYVLQIASKLPPKDVSKLIHYCCELAMKCPVMPADLAEVSAVHTLVLAWGGLDFLLECLLEILSGQVNVADLSTLILKFGKGNVAPRQVKLGRRHAESPWPSILTPTPGPLKQTKAMTETAKAKFTAASGAAWQVETLLSGDETRVAFLRNSHLQELLQALRTLAQIAIMWAKEGADALASTCHLESSILAYMKLYVHIVLDVSDESEQVKQISTKWRKGPSVSTSEALTEISHGFEPAWEELVGWLRDMLAKAKGNNGPFTSPSPSQPKTKRLLRSGGALSPLSPNILHGAGKVKKKGISTPLNSKVKNNEEMSTLVSKIVQVISDSFALGLVNNPSVRKVCADLVDDSIQLVSESFSRQKGSKSSLPQGLKEQWAYVNEIS